MSAVSDRGVSLSVRRLQSQLAQVQLSAMNSLRSWLTGMENRISLTAPLGPAVSALPAQAAEHAALAAEVAQWKPRVTELFDVLVVEDEDAEHSGERSGGLVGGKERGGTDEA